MRSKELGEKHRVYVELKDALDEIKDKDLRFILTELAFSHDDDKVMDVYRAVKEHSF